MESSPNPVSREGLMESSPNKNPTNSSSLWQQLTFSGDWNMQSLLVCIKYWQTKKNMSSIVICDSELSIILWGILSMIKTLKIVVGSSVLLQI